MTNYFKKIIKNLKKAKNNFGKAKREVGNWHEELGHLEREADLQKNLWKDLEKKNKVPLVVANSAQAFSQDLYEQSDYILKGIQNIKMRNLLSTAMTITDTSSSLAVSGAVFSYPSDELSESYYYKKIVDTLTQKNRQGEISQRLKAIDPSLADKYNNVWTTLHTLQRDETRAPMLLMREVINQLLHHFAPKDKVKVFYQFEENKEVTRSLQIKYIASQIKDLNKQKIFLSAEKSLNEIYHLLSKAKKHGKLNIKETEGYLYQANALIRLLLNSLD